MSNEEVEILFKSVTKV